MSRLTGRGWGPGHGRIARIGPVDPPSTTFYDRSVLPSKVQYTPPTRRDSTACRVESRWRCVRNSQLVAECRQSRRVSTNMPTAKSSCVVSAAWTHPPAVLTQFTIFCAFELSRLVTSDDTMTSLWKKLSYRSKFTVVKPLWSPFGQFQHCRTV